MTRGVAGAAPCGGASARRCVYHIKACDGDVPLYFVTRPTSHAQETGNPHVAKHASCLQYTHGKLRFLRMRDGWSFSCGLISPCKWPCACMISIYAIVGSPAFACSCLDACLFAAGAGVPHVQGSGYGSAVDGADRRGELPRPCTLLHTAVA